MKFLVDMPVSQHLAVWLRQSGFDALHVREIGLDRAADDLIVARARGDSRIIVTYDLDYPRLIALSGHTGPGLILFRVEGLSTQAIMKKLMAVFDALPAETLSSSIVVIDEHSVRVRSLPV